MTKREALRALRTALLALYDNPASIRRLVDDADVDAGQIDFQGAAQDIWHSVLTAADRQEQIDALVRVVDAPYQKNVALQQAYAAYQQLDQDSGDTAQTAARRSTQSTQTTINTGGGTYIAGNVNTGGGDFVGRDKKINR